MTTLENHLNNTTLSKKPYKVLVHHLNPKPRDPQKIVNPKLIPDTQKTRNPKPRPVVNPKPRPIVNPKTSPVVNPKPRPVVKP